MKRSFASRSRLLLFSGMSAFALATLLPAQTNTPTAASPSVEKDKETDKPIITTPSGLKYVDLVEGTGAAVKAGDVVVAKYIGTLSNGTKFDSSADHGGTITYEQGITALIPGWTEGTSTMKVGGKRKLIIPPILGYGQAGKGDVIPPNSTLIFEVEVISTNPQ